MRYTNETWQEENKEAAAEKKRKYARLKIEVCLRKRTTDVLKGKTKSGTILDIIGCSPKHLRIYIEKQFREGMTWKNYGYVWHLDHIKPLAAFNNIDDVHQQRIALHYTNLQPIFAEENFSKSSKWK